jgi:hypothetical protein
MSVCYKCKRCDNIETNNFTNLKKHLNRKNMCIKKKENFCYSNDQLLVYSLIPFQNDIQCISDTEIMHLQNSDKIEKNKKELFDDLDEIEKNKSKICKYCNMEFPLIMILKKHVTTHCFYNEIIKKEKIDNGRHKDNKDKDSKDNKDNKKIENNIDITNNILYNHIDNKTINNNNINIFLEVKNPVPFDKDWDISQINKRIWSDIIFSKYMYTKLLEEIMKTEINLNVVIDKDKDSGMVYKNDIDKYIQMKLNDIVSDTMEKLNKHLLEINKEKENDDSFDEIVDFGRKMINKKYIDFQKNPSVQQNVNLLISEIYEIKKNEAMDIAKRVMESPCKDKGY